MTAVKGLKRTPSKKSASEGYQQTNSRSLGKGPVVHDPGDENVVAGNGGVEGKQHIFKNVILYFN